MSEPCFRKSFTFDTVHIDVTTIGAEVELHIQDGPHGVVVLFTDTDAVKLTDTMMHATRLALQNSKDWTTGVPDAPQER